MSYKDEGAYCEATDQTLTLRCDVKGVITCRGPDNVRKYQRKCKSNTDPLCAVAIMVEKLRKAKLEGLKEKKEKLAESARLDISFRKPVHELTGICRPVGKVVVISAYANGVVKCSVRGCEMLNHPRCTTMRLYEVMKQVLAGQQRLGRKLTPEEMQEAVAKAKVKIDGLE